MLTNKLKEIRIQANMTQEQLADKTDVRRETIIRLEKSLYNPSLELAFKIANVLKCDINVIFQYSNDTIQEEPEQIEGQLEIDNRKTELTGISQNIIDTIDNMTYSDFLHLYIYSDNLLEEGRLTRKEVDYIDLINQIYDESPAKMRDPKEIKEIYFKESIQKAKELYKEIPNE